MTGWWCFLVFVLMVVGAGELAAGDVGVLAVGDPDAVELAAVEDAGGALELVTDEVAEEADVPLELVRDETVEVTRVELMLVVDEIVEVAGAELELMLIMAGSEEVADVWLEPVVDGLVEVARVELGPTLELEPEPQPIDPQSCGVKLYPKLHSTA